MCPRIVTAREEADRLKAAWIRRIQNRYSVAEHVADIQVPAVQHDLNAVRPAANIAVGQMMETSPDALRRNYTFLRRVRPPEAIGQRCETQETFRTIASSDLC